KSGPTRFGEVRETNCRTRPPAVRKALFGLMNSGRDAPAEGSIVYAAPVIALPPVRLEAAAHAGPAEF
ncbi:MAG: hypothetical protein WAK34_10040, partial [Rhodoplanes sp.]